MGTAEHSYHSTTEAEKARKPPRGVAIIGGGVIGLSTAYFLALSHREDARLTSSAPGNQRPQITIIESSDRLCPAASSQATGSLGSSQGKESKTGRAGLVCLSYRLQVRLAEQYNGKDEYGWSDQTIYRLQKKGSSDSSSPGGGSGSKGPPVSVPLSDLPAWVRVRDDWDAYRVSSPPNAAHLDPRRFCEFLTKRVKELGVRIETSATATSIQLDPAGSAFSALHVRTSSGLSQSIPADSVVIAAGPWSDRVFATLFPSAQVKLPMDSRGAAGNHARIRSPSGHGEDSVQVYFTNVTPDGSRFDVTSFPNGDLYIGGWGAVAEELPPLATQVLPQPAEIEKMITATKHYVKVPKDKDLEYHDAGRCYRPTAVPNRPIITRVPFDLLFDRPSVDASVTADPGGLYINTGHSSDGVALSLGSGKLASELILGQPLSVDISSLGLPGVASYL